jgi:hypothetical protein
VSYCQHDCHGLVEKKENSVREAVDQESAHILLDDRIHFGAASNLGESLFNAQKKISAGIQIVFPAFINDAQIPFPSRILICNHTIDLVEFQGREVVRVVNSHSKMSFHKFCPNNACA